MSKRTTPTDAGELNRKTEERKDRMKGDSAVEFGKNVGRSEDLENEPSRRSGLGSLESIDKNSTTGRH